MHVLILILPPTAAEVRKDVSSQYHNALFVGDVQERVKILKSVGQGNIQYFVAGLILNDTHICIFRFTGLFDSSYSWSS